MNSADVVFFVGGSVWTLDWCPRRPGWSSQVIQNEVLIFEAYCIQHLHLVSSPRSDAIFVITFNFYVQLSGTS